MAMSPDKNDREQDKFEEVGGRATVRTTLQSIAAGSGLATEAKQDDTITELQVINSLVPATYDYISLSYTGDNLTTVVFKTGGSGGTTVSTLTLAYTGSVLDSVTQT